MLCSLLVQASFGQTFDSLEDFHLRSNVQSVKVVSYKFKRMGREMTSLSNYFFSEAGMLQEKSDSLKRPFIPYPIQELDTTIYAVQTNTTGNFEIARRLMKDSTEYEIHYRYYNEEGLVAMDSIRYGSHGELMFHEGPITHKYLYDSLGNLTYSWFKSSYVFALRDHSAYEYEYDDRGNWIVRKEYYLSNSVYPRKSLKPSDFNSRPRYIVKREILYY